MVVGAAAIEIHVHGSRSLKEKRGVVRSISQRVRNRFNLSVAEVGGLDRWQTAVLGVAAAGANAAVVRRVLERAVVFVEDLHLAEGTHADSEIVSLPYQAGEDPAAEDEAGDPDEDAEDAWE